MKKLRKGCYYIFNSKSLKEKIIFADNQSFDELNILSDENSYILGTYLSGFMEVYSYLSDENIIGIYEEIMHLLNLCKDYLPITDDKYIYTLAQCLSFCFGNKETEQEHQQDMKNVAILYDYVVRCEENKQICNLNEFLKYENSNGIVQKQCEEFISGIDKITDDALNGIKKVEPDIQIYEIETLIDLLSAFIQAAFSKNKIIKECENCYKTFIPLKRNDEKYCTYKLVGDNTNCKSIAHTRNKKTYFSDPEIQQLYDKLRKRLYNRIRNAEYNKKDISDSAINKALKDYDDFIDMYKQFTERIYESENLIKNSDEHLQNDLSITTEIDLLIWLKEFDEKTSK